jgi:hypothetical protein
MATQPNPTQQCSMMCSTVTRDKKPWSLVLWCSGLRVSQVGGVIICESRWRWVGMCLDSYVRRITLFYTTLFSWRWAYWCPKHGEIKEAEWTSYVLHLVGSLLHLVLRCTVTWTSNLTKTASFQVFSDSLLTVARCCMDSDAESVVKRDIRN